MVRYALFSILVEPTTVNDDDIFDSSDEASALTALVSETTALKNEVETKLANGEFTPKKGVDYYTEEDLAELDAKVEEAERHSVSAFQSYVRTAEYEASAKHQVDLATMCAGDAQGFANTAKSCVAEVEAKRGSIVQDVLDSIINGDEVAY